MNEDLAFKIIYHAFQHKKDLAGEPYVKHLERVASKFSGEIKVVAILHDLLEDCPEWNEEALRALFWKNIVDSVVVLTKLKGEDYDKYIKRVSKDSWATRVKIEDLKDNMDITRLKNISDKDVGRLRKYIKAYEYLTARN